MSLHPSDPRKVRKQSSNQWAARLSFSILIYVLGTTPIKVSFDHALRNFYHSNKKRLPVLEIYLRGTYITVVLHSVD